MRGEEPFILLRARVRGDGAPFVDWFRREHLREAARIPGIASVHWGMTRGGTLLGVYRFHDVDALQQSFGSAEAARARDMWSRWADRLEEFSVEMQFALTAPTLALSPN